MKSKKIYVDSSVDVEAVPDVLPNQDTAKKPFSFVQFVRKNLDKVTKLQTVVADTEDLPTSLFTQARTQSFITLDKNSGVCKDDLSLDQCCEVPTSVTGIFLADVSGKWNSEPYFSYSDQIYGVTLTALQYTNAQWSNLMRIIESSLHAIGNEKGALRDLSWNLVAWSSFSAITESDSGVLRFYASGEVSQMYNKPIFATGFASAYSDVLPCYVSTTTSYQSSGRMLTVNTPLYNYANPNLAYTDPCPNVLNPKTMAYSPYDIPTTMEWKIDMASVNTAIAVNLGILPLKNLEEFQEDQSRKLLLFDMYQLGTIDWETYLHTSSYYDILYAPMMPIYCVTYPATNESSCFVRIGNMLFFPTIVHFGYYENFNYVGSLKRCDASAVEESMPSLYCNLFDLIVGLIYYPSVPSTPNNRLLEEQMEVFTNYSRDPTKLNQGKIDLLKKQAIERASRPVNINMEIPEAPRKAIVASVRSPLSTDTKMPIFTLSEVKTAGTDDDYSVSSNATYMYYSPDTVDNGLIFAMGRYSASQRTADTRFGDKAIPDAAYKALVGTIGNYFPESNYTEIFNTLCSMETNGLPDGCAVFAIEFYNGIDLTISEYNFQPINAAFHNTLFDKVAMDKIATVPPTRLTQEYYSCVYSKWSAFFQATGLAASNTQLYISICLVTYLYVLIHILRNGGKHVPWKHEKDKQETVEKERVHAVVLALEKDIKGDNSRLGTLDTTLSVLKKLDSKEKDGAD